MERVRILHAICRTEQNSTWRGRFRVFGQKIVPVSAREATERRAPHGDAVMSGAKVDGPEFWGLTRLPLCSSWRQSPDFQHGAQRKARALSGGVESRESAASGSST